MLDVSILLPPESCNIGMSFVSEGNYPVHRIVRRGRLEWNIYDVECGKFEFVSPCGIMIVDIPTTCSGTITFSDDKGNLAKVIDLTVERKFCETRDSPQFSIS